MEERKVTREGKDTNKMNIMEIIQFRINRYGNTPIFGVCLSEGQNWLVIRENEVDYYLGGIKFINKKFIRHRIIVDNDAMKLTILSSKYSNYEKDKSVIESLNLDNNTDLFQSLKNKSCLLGVGLNKKDIFFVGRIENIYEKSISLRTIGTFTEDCGMMNIPFDRIRFVDIDTDYLNSLNLYMENKKGMDKNK